MYDDEIEVDGDVIRVSGKTNAKSLASVLAKSVVSGHRPKLRAIGAGAVNQSSKACAIAAGYVAPRGIQLTFIIGFDDVQGDGGKPISAMSFRPVVSGI